MSESTLFRSWWQGGFEASTMRFSDHRRVDAVAATRHDVRAAEDYALLRKLGIRTVRDGLRWPLIDAAGRYDWSSWRPMLKAATATGTQVIWDLMHFGMPDDVDPWSDGFVERFAGFSEAAARLFREETDAVPWWAPVNEISFWAFAGGEHAHFAPFGRAHGDPWKRQLVRCSLAAMTACLSVDPRARFLHTDPVIHTAGEPTDDFLAVERNRISMFQAWDMIAGLKAPELGGSRAALDVVGVNFYGNNQRMLDGREVPMGGIHYRPFHRILIEVWERYGRPLVLSEIGAEGANGPGWLRYVAGEVRLAQAAGVPVEGLCLYPVMDYAGWNDDRHCPIGLISVDEQWEARRIEPLLAAELRREQAMARLLDASPAIAAIEAHRKERRSFEPRPEKERRSALI